MISDAENSCGIFFVRKQQVSPLEIEIQFRAQLVAFLHLVFHFGIGIDSAAPRFSRFAPPPPLPARDLAMRLRERCRIALHASVQQTFALNLYGIFNAL